MVREINEKIMFKCKETWNLGKIHFIFIGGGREPTLKMSSFHLERIQNLEQTRRDS